MINKTYFSELVQLSLMNATLTATKTENGIAHVIVKPDGDVSVELSFVGEEYTAEGIEIATFRYSWFHEDFDRHKNDSICTYWYNDDTFIVDDIRGGLFKFQYAIVYNGETFEEESFDHLQKRRSEVKTNGGK